MPDNCSLPRPSPLDLHGDRLNTIIAAVERRRQHQGRSWSQPVCHHALEFDSDVRGLRHDKRNRPPRANGALSDLLAAGLRIYLPAGAHRVRRRGFNSRFLPHDNWGQFTFSCRSQPRTFPVALAQSSAEFFERQAGSQKSRKTGGRQRVRAVEWLDSWITVAVSYFVSEIRELAARKDFRFRMGRNRNWTIASSPWRRVRQQRPSTDVQHP